MRFVLALLAAILTAAPAFATSSINTTQPVQGYPYNASPIRLNFGAAATDIGALQTMNAGATSPASPQNGYLWLDTPNAATIYPLNIYDGNSWVPVAALDTANHLWLAPVGGGALPSIPSASTADLGSVLQATVQVTGNNTIGSFGTSAPVGTVKFVTFTGAPTLDYNSVSLILPGAANISVSAGDSLIAQQYAAGDWRVLAYQPNVSPALGTGGIGNIVAATTTDLGTLYNAAINVSGATTITSFGTTASAGTLKYLTFTGAPLLTYNATSLLLPGAQNIQLAAGDTMLVEALGSGNWRALFYTPVSGTAACLAGTTAPPSPKPGACWTNTSASPNLREIYDGSSWLIEGSVDTTNHIWQPPISGGVEQDLTAAATVDLGSVPGANVTIVGSTTINAFGSSAAIGTVKMLTFADPVTVTASTAIIIPGESSVNAKSGDVWLVKYLGSGNWRQISSLTASGAYVTGPATAPPVGNAAAWNGGLTIKDGGAPPGLSVPTNAALQALSTASAAQVQRQGFYEAGDSPGVVYTGETSACSLNAGAGDNGTQVQSSNSGCWVASPSDPKDWGATGSSVALSSCGISIGLDVLTCSSVGDFLKGMPIAIPGAGAATSTSAPSLAVTAHNGSGTTYYYTVAPIDGSMGIGAAIAAVSVSGGYALGNPLDLKLALTGNTHGNTTLDNLQIGGIACTQATCPLAVGAIIKPSANFPSTTTISSINSATSVTLSNAALTTATDVGVTMYSPGGGVYNTLAVTGTASAFALYEGPSSSLSSGQWTCIGTLDGVNGTAIEGQEWNDYGANDYESCPSWIPSQPPAASVNEALRTTVASVGGSSITLAANAVATVSGGVAYHDDTTPLQSATSAGLPLVFSCGTYNIFAGLTTSTTYLADGKDCAKIAGYGAGFNDWTWSQASNAAGNNFIVDDTNKASGFAIASTKGYSDSWYNWLFYHPFSVAHFNSDFQDAIYQWTIAVANQTRGDACLYLTANRNTTGFSEQTAMYNVTCSTTKHGYFALLDGDVDSTFVYNLGAYPSQYGLYLQNTVGAGAGPSLFTGRNVAFNNMWGAPIRLVTSESDIIFDKLFLQGDPGDGTSCIAATSGAAGSLVISGGSQIFGCDLDGINVAGGNLQIDDGTSFVYGNNSSGGTYAKIHAQDTANGISVNLAPGDPTAANPNEECGVELDSGYGGSGIPLGSPIASLTSTAPGYEAPVCDNSGAGRGVVAVDGKPSPTFESNASGGTLSTSDMLGRFVGANPRPVVYLSGNVLGSPENWTTPTATALIAAVNGAYVNQSFTFVAYNIGSSTLTLVGGTGVTVSGTFNGVAAGGWRPFNCVVTNVSAAISCAGQ